MYTGVDLELLLLLPVGGACVTRMKCPFVGGKIFTPRHRSFRVNSLMQQAAKALVTVGAPSCRLPTMPMVKLIGRRFENWSPTTL